jgi:DNA ligase 1
MAGKEKELSSFIVDCEIVAVNKTTRQLLPFQVLATRSRKATKASDIEVHVNMFAFDILYFDGCITHLPLIERR